MHIVKTQTDKLIVGTNDTSYTAPDTSPTGTAVLNGPVYVGKTAASPGYEAVMNVASNSAPQNPLDINPRCNASLALKVDGDSKFVGDGKTGVNAVVIEGDLYVVEELIVVTKVDSLLDLQLLMQFQNHLI